jgi:hypothetical protein
LPERRFDDAQAFAGMPLQQFSVRNVIRAAICPKSAE